MAEVIDIRFKKEGLVKLIHSSGWERGFKSKGDWEGPYQSMGLLPNTNVTYFAKGMHKQGMRVGVWEVTFIPHNREIPLSIMLGKYLNNERHGEWIIRKSGKPIEKYIYENGEVIKKI